MDATKRGRFPVRYAVPIAAILAASMAVSAHAVTVGPDAFGYLATDEVTFAWQDISASGSTWQPVEDDSAKTAKMGFDFTIYGKTYAYARFSDNGLITFGNENTQETNVDLTSQSPAWDLPTIAVLWDDWRITASAPAYYETLGTVPGDRRFIVQWDRVEAAPGSPDTVTFQAILYEGTGTILLQYQDVVVTGGDGFHDNGLSATVGIRDTGGQTSGRNLQWSYNQAVIDDGMAIKISVIPEPVTMAGLMLGIGCLARYVRGRRGSNTATIRAASRRAGTDPPREWLAALPEPGL